MTSLNIIRLSKDQMLFALLEGCVLTFIVIVGHYFPPNPRVRYTNEEELTGNLIPPP